jgi:hypothetical protein
MPRAALQNARYQTRKHAANASHFPRLTIHEVHQPSRSKKNCTNTNEATGWAKNGENAEAKKKDEETDVAHSMRWHQSIPHAFSSNRRPLDAKQNPPH